MGYFYPQLIIVNLKLLFYETKSFVSTAIVISYTHFI